MSEIEKIELYISRTNIPMDLHTKYDMMGKEWKAMAAQLSPVHAISLAFQYGQAKGYRAAKAEGKRA
ncbi:MAG: hypothetical protein HDT15_01535 [Oscillibacter sp.]|nr:hypothetical protein [Oscillibacter sp.]